MQVGIAVGLLGAHEMTLQVSQAAHSTMPLYTLYLSIMYTQVSTVTTVGRFYYV